MRVIPRRGKKHTKLIGRELITLWIIACVGLGWFFGYIVMFLLFENLWELEKISALYGYCDIAIYNWAIDDVNISWKYTVNIRIISCSYLMALWWDFARFCMSTFRPFLVGFVEIQLYHGRSGYTFVPVSCEKYVS